MSCVTTYQVTKINLQNIKNTEVKFRKYGLHLEDRNYLFSILNYFSN